MTRFPDTRGSLVAAVKGGDGEARARALETLAEAYWKPVYTYVRLKAGRSHEEAADLTQEFFARLVEKDWLVEVRRRRRRASGRTCASSWTGSSRTSRRRRGASSAAAGCRSFRSTSRTSGARSRSDAELGELSPEDFFEREWVRSVFSLAVERFRERCAADGKDVRFALFSAYDLEGDAAAERPRYEDLARRFETTAVDVTNQLAAARRDFRRVVLDLLRELTVSDAEFRAEARALLGVEPPA